MRLVDADELEREICRDQCEREAKGCGICCELIAYIENAPTVDAVPVKHGQWINIANGNCDDLCKCSECKETWLGIGGYNYCPNCGAKMDGERRENDG